VAAFGEAPGKEWLVNVNYRRAPSHLTRSRFVLDKSGLDRLYVRGLDNVHKKFLIQAAACNLALLMRSTFGSGKPRAAHDRAAEAILMILALIEAVEDIFSSASAVFQSNGLIFRLSEDNYLVIQPVTNPRGLDTAC